MYQLDVSFRDILETGSLSQSWCTVLFELLLVGFSLYNSLRMTKWWNTVAGEKWIVCLKSIRTSTSEGTAIGVNGAKRVPSVADLYGIRTNEKKSSYGKDNDSVRNGRREAIDWIVSETCRGGRSWRRDRCALSGESTGNRSRRNELKATSQ